MDIVNNLCNQLLIRCGRPIFILKKAKTSKKENLEYLQIFRSSISNLILNKKRIKSDMQKTWKGIFIGYMEIFKHLKI